MTYHKHDRVTVNTPTGPMTLTITKLLIASDSYMAVTGSGKPMLLTEPMIVGLA